MSQETIIFSMAGVGKIIPPNRQILKNIYLSFFYGAKIGVLGLNGSGKSTLLRIIAGIDKNYNGEVVFSPGYSVGMLEQEPQIDPTKTVREIVEEGVAEVVSLLKEFDQINEAFGEPDADFDKLIARQAEVQEKLDHHNAWELDTRLERAMDALRTPPSDALISTLSGGEKRRVALCRLLLQEPDVLLLDEPTNHLDAESVLWLEEYLRQYKGTVIAVTHDRYFLDNVAGWILELDRGEGIPWKGNYSSWLEQKEQRLAKEEKTESKRQKTLQRELEWVRMAPKARQAKSKARLGAYEKLLDQDARQREEKLEIFIPAGPRLGAKVIEAQDVAKAFGDRLLYEHLNFSLPQGGIVGVIGPNGAGKTTLFKLITEQLRPDAGTFDVGETVKLAYVDQEHDGLDPNKTVYQTISEGNDWVMLGGKQTNARAYCSRFNFAGADQEKKLGTLSGGERNRVHLAIALKEGGNLLLLDEPTNDLDVNTLRALEEGLENFAGCAVVISHDRWFLDRIATHILAFEGDSQVYWFEGNFSEYEENRRKRLGTDATPKRIKYKKLV
ncbi:MAG: energy-dependent translational throttle protein EttA [Cytophagales bacterium]|nr:MAG: energy-dependent translational throttle protein EttA [Cytophagales bacterium]